MGDRVDFAEYVELFRKRWRWIVAAGATGLLAGIVLTVAGTPIYTSTAQVFVSVRGGDNTADLVQGNTFTTKQVASYAKLVDSPRVLEPVIKELGLDETARTLAEKVTAEAPIDTVLINITAQNDSAEISAATANATAESLARVVADVEKPSSTEPSPVRISTVVEASAPTEPASPSLKINTVLGLLLGLGAGITVAFLREKLDTRIRTQEDVRAVTDSAIIGAISYDESAERLPLIVHESPHSPRSEAFRRLRTNLQFLALDQSRRAIVVTSAIPGEGKSTTSINMAISLADAGTRVVLVDADLRRPSVSKYMGLEGVVGLTTVLIGRVAVEDAIQSWGNENLHVLPSGQVPPNPSELLGSMHMAELVGKLENDYDVVILDTAPLLPVTDGAVLAKLAGGAVIVVGAGVAHRTQVEDAILALSTVDAPVLGIVVNRLPAADRGSYYRYEYQYQPVAEDKRGDPRTWPRHGRANPIRAVWDTAFPSTDEPATGSASRREPAPAAPTSPPPPPPPAEQVFPTTTREAG